MPQLRQNEKKCMAYFRMNTTFDYSLNLIQLENSNIPRRTTCCDIECRSYLWPYVRNVIPVAVFVVRWVPCNGQWVDSSDGNFHTKKSSGCSIGRLNRALSGSCLCGQMIYSVASASSNSACFAVWLHCRRYMLLIIQQLLNRSLSGRTLKLLVTNTNRDLNVSFKPFKEKLFDNITKSDIQLLHCLDTFAHIANILKRLSIIS